MSHSIVSQVVEEMTTLPSDLQRLVLDYVQKLKASSAHGVPGSQLVKFAGLISPEDLEEISQAIEAGCEQV